MHGATCTDRFSSLLPHTSLSTQDLREMCDKRDVYKKSYQRAADERDSLAAQVAHLQRKLAEQDSSSNKKEASALRMVCGIAVGACMRWLSYLSVCCSMCSGCRSLKSATLGCRSS